MRADIEPEKPFPVGFVSVEKTPIDHLGESRGLFLIEVIADGGGHTHDLVAVRDHELSLRENADVVEVMRRPEKHGLVKGLEHRFLQGLQLGGMLGFGGLHNQTICGFFQIGKTVFHGSRARCFSASERMGFPNFSRNAGSPFAGTALTMVGRAGMA